MRPGQGPVLDAVHRVLTPEYVEFDFVVAGLYVRFIAWLIDALIVFMTSAAILTVLSLAMFAFPGFASALGFIIWFLVDWGYAIALETAWSGQTMGKRILGLRVIQESGVRIGFYQAVLRNLARAFDRLPLFYLVGGVAALFSNSHQRFGDMLAGTLVVRERRPKIPAPISRPAGETQLLDDPAFVARVAKLTNEEEAVVLSAAIRRDELTLEARLKLFSALCERLQRNLGLEKPEHLSDEKLVLLVAAVLARRGQKPPGKKLSAQPS
jgi:uncharacterized RDD family membrane protein YckC